MSLWLGLAVTVVLLALNALFVASEFALISARRTQLEPAAAHGSRAAKLALRAMENISLMMAAAQLGITICSLLLGAVSEPAIAHAVEPAFEQVGVPHVLVHPVSFSIALTLVVYAHVVIGEMVPKNLALAAPDKASLVLGPFMLAVVAVLKPLVIALNAVANAALRLLRIEPKDEVASTFTHDEVSDLVEESRREGLLDDDEYELVQGALEFQGGSIDDVLLPTDVLVTIDRTATAADVEVACAESGFSRFPVRDGNGALGGYLHVKDALETEARARERVIADKWVRPLVTVPVGASLFDALRLMQARGSHMARVADAEGRVVGVVMLEDVLEELVGEVRATDRPA
ncbi:MAG: hemolysin family protein [Aeromicrobium sp.]|uniref:hemolysin family protein n=1 Tax=Aeromicrobium sp. TaxID=1871063 RepID=UPI0039E2EF2D